MVRTDLGSRTALSASRERRGVSLSSPSCSTTSITNSVVGSCTDHEAPTILSAVVCGRQRACCDRAARWRWSQRRAERAGRRFVTRSCVERWLWAVSVRVLCDVPSMEVSGETSAAGVAVKGTYVPRVTVAQKCLHVPYTCRSTHVQTSHIQRSESVGDALDGAADGASAAAAGRAPATKSPAARAVRVVEVPQPARGQVKAHIAAAASARRHSRRGRRRHIADRRRWGAPRPLLLAARPRPAAQSRSPCMCRGSALCTWARAAPPTRATPPHGTPRHTMTDGH